MALWADFTGFGPLSYILLKASDLGCEDGLVGCLGETFTNAGASQTSQSVLQAQQGRKNVSLNHNRGKSMSNGKSMSIVQWKRQQ